MSKKFKLALPSFGAILKKGQIPVRASALTYTSLLSLVPSILLLSLALKILGFVEILYQSIPNIESYLGIQLPPQLLLLLQENIERVQDLSWGRLGIFGFIALFFGISIALSNIEKAMNIIWGITQNRSWLLRIPLYSPLLLFLGGCGLLILFLLTQLKYTLSSIDFLHNDIFEPFLSSIPIIIFLIISWLYVFFLFYFMPNTKVYIKVAIIGATLTSISIYTLIQIIISFQTHLFSRYSLLYGSLSILPVTMITLYLCWILFLIGVAFTCSLQKGLYPSSISILEKS